MASGDDVITVNRQRVLLRSQAAARAGVQPDTWNSYVSRGWPRGNPAPKPDGQIDGRTPYWFPATVDAWKRRRPRAGADPA